MKNKRHNNERESGSAKQTHLGHVVFAFHRTTNTSKPSLLPS